MGSIDTTPSTVATNALAAIPFSALIGGPLGACIDAQAKAAQTTLDYIQAVGLNTDKDGNKTAITVTFTYTKAVPGQSAAQNVSVTVPLLTIVPIPYLRVEDLSIKFKASIAADASTSETDTSSSSLGVEAGASLNISVFNASLKASYSSKKDSTATAASKYSVEYTMDVELTAKNDDMPAGLAKLLNLLTDSIGVAQQARLAATYDGTANITGSLADGSGTAIASAPLSVTIVSGNATIAGGKTASTGADGSIKIPITAGSAATDVKIDWAGAGAVSRHVSIPAAGAGH